MVAPFYDIPVYRPLFFYEGVYSGIEQDGSRLGDWGEGQKRTNPTAA